MHHHNWCVTRVEGSCFSAQNRLLTYWGTSFCLKQANVQKVQKFWTEAKGIYEANRKKKNQSHNWNLFYNLQYAADVFVYCWWLVSNWILTSGAYIYIYGKIIKDMEKNVDFCCSAYKQAFTLQWHVCVCMYVTLCMYSKFHVKIEMWFCCQKWHFSDAKFWTYWSPKRPVVSWLNWS